jgi:hypothetical protein
MTNNQKIAVTTLVGSLLLFVFLSLVSQAKDWETLVAGAMSVTAAVWAGFLLMKQINQTETHEQNRLKRKFIAARATLPLALTELCDFCKRSTDQLKPVYVYARSTVATTVPPFELQTIPDSVMAILNAVLETTPHDAIADRLSDMLAMIQVFQSRLKSMRDSNFHSGNMFVDETIQSYIINSGEIYTLASSLFDYARKKTEYSAAVTLDDLMYDKVLDAFRIFEMYSAAFDPIRDTVNRYLTEGFRVAWEIF